MWFNSKQNEEPYPVLTLYRFSFLETENDPLEILDDITGAAWPSSARVVRCWVKSRNERNPCHQLLRKGTLMRLPVTNRRKVGMTSGPHGPYG